MTPEPERHPEAGGRGSAIVGVAIVSWNVRELLLRCLGSLGVGRAGDVGDVGDASGIGDVGGDGDAGDLQAVGGSTPSARSVEVDSADVVVVDNASSDGSAKAVRAAFPGVTIIENAINRGFTGGNNQAFRALRIGIGGGEAVSGGGPRSGGEAEPVDERDAPPFVLILNPDAELVGDALGALVRHLAAQPGAGAVGPLLRYPDGRIQSSRRRFPTLGSALFEGTPAEWWWPGNPWAKRYRMEDMPPDVASEVDWLNGAAILFRSAALAEVGGFDEGFFMYAEELDLCRRLRAAGWTTRFEPAAEVIHHEGRSSEQVAPARHRHFMASRARYVSKHFGGAAGLAVRSGLVAEHAVAAAIEGAKWLLGHRRSLRAARVRAYGAVIADLVTGREVPAPGTPDGADMEGIDG